MSTLLGPGGEAISSTPNTAATDAPSGDVIETTTQTFARDVLEASRDMVVLVDFWAPWCGPCKQLAPVLEKTVKAFAGSVRLVKMNIDDHPEIAGQLGIRSIPAVIAFRQGQPMDGFMGAQTEQQIRTFIERVAGPATDGVAELLAEADQARAAGAHEQAMMLYGEVLQRDQENVQAIAGLGMVSIEAGNLEGAKEMFGSLPEPMKKEPPIQALEAAIRLAEQGATLGEAAQLEAAVAADPNDFQARFDYAVALAAEGDRKAAVDQLVEIMRRDREWNEGAAQKELINFFDAWGPADPATAAGRRKMASILFA
ncbi:thioredoxin [Acuticoccus sp. M5D2P5]|uniref:thioredoxin n=1 Tax=Acuticoccus kalidii TaxID=2910977 RepID=UPI001F023820|nr:thioredoxin [Acuticoccus kalidii]MCF3935953.1 thioredoxin [Acuticoccus kalidii]